MRWMLILALSIFSSVVFAGGADVPAELDKRYVESLQQLSAKLTECRKAEKTIDISDLIDKAYKAEVIKKIIAYSYAQAKFECSQSEYTNYLVLSNAYAEFLPSEGLDQKQKIDSIVSSYEKYRWEAIQNYSQLPKQVKQYAESLEYLKQPFEMFGVIDQINAM